jgi:anti-sigma factor RsiW
MTNAKGSAAPSDELLLLVHAYLDGELDPANSLAVARQIAADPVLAGEVERIEALRQAVREKLLPEPVPRQLRSRIEAAATHRSAAAPTRRSPHRCRLRSRLEQTRIFWPKARAAASRSPLNFPASDRTGFTSTPITSACGTTARNSSRRLAFTSLSSASTPVTLPPSG